jgi:membrane-associated PAP2 superfamily phosphatase
MTLYDFLSGAVALGFAACALFFLRFWRRTREELFLAFAIAFLLLGVGQTILALANLPTEERGALYLIRLAAFALILVAIYRKNQTARG